MVFRGVGVEGTFQTPAKMAISQASKNIGQKIIMPKTHPSAPPLRPPKIWCDHEVISAVNPPGA